MASIFISHSGADNAWAQKLKEWLEAAPRHHSVFLDFDREAGLKAGDLWEEKLYARLRQCQVVLALVSRNWLASRWCFAEAVQAREKGKRLILARIEIEADAKALFRDAQHLDFAVDETDALSRLEAALSDVFDLDPGREPYPGLVPFDERDAGVFVGRDPEVSSLLETLESLRVKSRAGGERLLLLLGASGSGKSSLIRAGVLPRLRRLSERWQVLPPMRPGRDPEHELAFSLAIALGRSIDDVAQELAGRIEDSLGEEDGAGTLEVLARDVRLAAGQPDGTVLLVLDQMEELLGLSGAPQRARFLELLHNTLERGDGRLLVLATLRSEYLDEIQLLLSQPSQLPYRELTLDPVPHDRLHDIIREPGRRWRQPVEFEDSLAERMVRDTGTRDALPLPLLAFTLHRLWRDPLARADGVFQLEEYVRLGGLEGSVRTAASEALVDCSPTDLEVLRRVFVPGLVRVNAEGVRTRHRAFLAPLPQETRALLKPFIDLGLLVTDRDPDGRETVEVAHETLLRTWPQLDIWLKDDQDALRLLDGLERATRDWESGNRSQELIAHQSGRLSEVGTLLLQPRFRSTVSPAELEYLGAADEAEAKREDQVLMDQARRINDAERIAEEQRKVAQRTRIGALVALFLMVVAAAGAVLAWQQRDRAEAVTLVAQQAQSDAEEATLDAQHARLAEETRRQEAQDNLRDALVLQARLLCNSGEVGKREEGIDAITRAAEIGPSITLRQDLATCLDQPDLAVADLSGASVLRDENADLALANFLGRTGTEQLGVTAASPAAQRVAVVLGTPIVNEFEVHLFDYKGNEVLMWKVGAGYLDCLAFSSDGTILGASIVDDSSHVVRLWDLEGKEIASLVGDSLASSSGRTGSCLDFSENGRFVALAGQAGNLTIWDLTALRLDDSYTVDPYAVFDQRVDVSDAFSVQLSDEGDFAVTLGEDGRLKLWSVATGDLIASTQSMSQRLAASYSSRPLYNIVE